MEEPAQENNRLFVGNLPFSMTNEDLKAMFEKVEGSEVTDAIIVMDKNGRFGPRSKGYGFVTLATAEQAQKAAQELNGSEADGRKIAVDFARPRKQEDNSGAGMADAA